MTLLSVYIGRVNVIYHYKTFDKVPHSLLFHKLTPRYTLLWLNSFLKERPQYVVLENQKSNSTPVLSGALQDMMLATLLFLLYINDLHTCVYCTLLPIVIYDGFHDSNVCIS